MTELRNALFIIFGLAVIGNLLFSGVTSFVCAVIGIVAIVTNVLLLVSSAIKKRKISA